MARTPAGLAKSNQNSSPTPAGTPAWNAMRQQQQEGQYQYSQLSPSRSPSGPTYTQLSSGINSRPAYHTTTSAQQQQSAQAGYYGWSHPAADGSGPSASHNPSVPVGPAGQHHPQQGQELSDMLQMLGDQTGPATFEDLNIHMFNTPFE